MAEMKENEYREMFAKNLRGALEEKDVSMRELARRLNVSSTIVSAWCSGKKAPRMDKIDAICRILNINRSRLLLSDSERAIEKKEVEQMARQILRLDPYRRALIESIINTDPEGKK